MTSDESPVDARVIACIASALNKKPAELSAEQRLVEDLRVDSVDKFSILMALEKEFDRHLEDEELASFVTIGDILRFARAAAAEHG